MTISSTNRKDGPYTGNGVTTALPFSFKVFSSADVRVVRADLAGDESDLTFVTDYTVTLNADQDSNPGGTVNLVTAAATGYLTTLTSVVANLQPVVLTNAGGFYPRVLNTALDRLTIMVQQLAEKVGRALQYSISSPLGDSALPTPVANNIIGWNSSANGFQNYPPSDNTLLSAAIAASSGSSLVGHIQSGAGAVATTVQSKLRESVSVKDFGAVGNGSTDDLTAFTNAIAYLHGTGGGVLRVPAGNYVTNSFFEFTADNITVEGAGDSTVFKSFDTTTDGHCIFKITGNNNTLRRFKVDGNRSAISQPDGFLRDGVCLYGDDTVIDEITSINNVASGIRIQNGNIPLSGVNANVRNCVVKDCGAAYAANNAFGIIIAYIVGVTVTGNKVTNVVASGIFNYGCVQQTISNNVLTGTENAIRTQPVNTTPTGGDSYATITGNIVYGAAGDGIRFTGNYVTVSGNTVTGCTSNGSGLFSQGGSHVTLSGNTLANNQNYGIAIGTVSGSPADDITIVGNTCYGNAVGLILSPGSTFPITNVFVSENNLKGNTDKAIRVNAAGASACSVTLAGGSYDYNNIVLSTTNWIYSNSTKRGINAASASTMALSSGDFFAVTGTADISFISGMSEGTEITLQFYGNAAASGVISSFTGPNNIRLSTSNFAYTTYDMLKLVNINDTWWEVSRSVNA